MERQVLKLPSSNLFYPPETPLAPSGEGKPATAKTADDINDMFKELDTPETEEKPVVRQKEKAQPEAEEEPEEKEDDLDLIDAVDEDAEKLDLEAKDDEIDIAAPPRKKEILKKYPEIFKDFPFLEKVMYRDRQYNELFGSFDDAKELAGKAEVFNQFENQLLAGNTEDVLRNIKEADPKAFNIITDDYLQTLAKVDKEAYFHVVGNLNKRLIMEMVEASNESGNEDLKAAALIVNQFLFSSAKFTGPTRLVDRSKDEEVNEVEQERLSYVKERFETSRDELQGQVDNTLKATISEYIDPRGTMSPYVKKNAVADAMKFLTAAIAADPTVSTNLNRLWRDAFDNKFARDKLVRIKSFYLSKAKANLKSAIVKARAEALKDSSPRKEREEQEEETSARPRRPITTTGRSSQPQNKNGMRKGESVADFFARD
jgi:hypothetical protein